MMEKTLTDLTTDDLLNKKKQLYTVLGCLATGLIVLIAMIFLLVTKGGLTAVTIALSIIPIALLPILFLILNQLKPIKKELLSRNPK